ncbi:Zinc finger protein 598 [Plakobranchus ocellatus]|uniref:Zinc finger protein 598 n=1 Tax=Plakobranchus ocellatus TaxID=259542 RepID=A0AAV4D4P2_9GAST|nr:Zinc finger protein 598 [Plakobranchus ocellatus]
MQRALEASKESFASESTQAQSTLEERVPDPVHDFPTLSGAAVSAAAIRTITMQEEKSPEEDFPSLSAGRGNAQVSTSRRQVPAPSKAYSSVMNPTVKPTPVIEKRESKLVSLHVLSSTKKTLIGSRPVPPAPSEDDFPSLGGNTAGPRPASQGSWLAKSSSSTLPASAVVASKTLAISKVPSKPISVTKIAPFIKPISDEKEFPALGGRDRNTVNGEHKSVSEWTTVQSGGSKKATTPRSERVDDDSFELPQSYYTSLADPTASSNISLVNEEPEPVLKLSSRSAPPTSSSTKDFPGLPTRDKKTIENTNDKKQKKNNSNSKTKKARDRPKAQEKNPPEEAKASLSEIAQALVQPQSGSSNRMNDSVRSTAKANSEKQIDWFDGPSTKLAENSIHNGGKEEKCKDAPQINALSIAQPQESDNNSSGSIDESFPSLHSMSTSVQLQPQQMPKKPPGLPDPPSASTPSPPPGFGAVMNRVSSLKAISSTLTPVPTPPPGFTSTVPYIQPPDFKTRNTQLIAAIREALETVEDGFDNFRALSGQFRQGMMEASDYLSSIQALMGPDDFKHIFPELLALLPDVLKQKQLWELHQATGSFGLKGKGGALQKSLQTSSTSDLTQCPTCGQVTVSRDAQHHLLQHGGGLADDENFPLLNGFNSGSADSRAASSTSSKDSSLKINGAWIKAK